MGADSTIEWTDATWNPVTGCTKISSGCLNCYAETFAERFRGVAGHPYEQGFDLKLWYERLDLPLKWRKPKRIFVNSMSDLFHKDVPDDFILKVFDTMVKADWHTFQILTKRADRLLSLDHQLPWRPHIWAGVSVENSDVFPRIECLRKTGAAVKFLSIEPLLGPLYGLDLTGIDWVIAGGESGHKARPVQQEWIRDLKDQCVLEGVPFFFKQWGGKNKKAAGRLLDGRVWDQMPREALMHELARAHKERAPRRPEQTPGVGR